MGGASAVTGGDRREEDRAKVGLPALDLSLAFPQATPASIFLPSGECFIPPLNFAGIRSEGIVIFGPWNRECCKECDV